VRAEALRLFDLLDLPLPDEPEIIIEPIEVELTQDISRSLPRSAWRDS
jgi:hypothetical protein